MPSRITRAQIDAMGARASAQIGVALTVQHSATGYSVARPFGAGAQILAECLTARETYETLRALEIGARIGSAVDRQALDAIAQLLSAADWSSDHLAAVAETVAATGRTIADL